MRHRTSETSDITWQEEGVRFLYPKEGGARVARAMASGRCGDGEGTQETTPAALSCFPVAGAGGGGGAASRVRNQQAARRRGGEATPTPGGSPPWEFGF